MAAATLRARPSGQRILSSSTNHFSTSTNTFVSSSVGHNSPAPCHPQSTDLIMHIQEPALGRWILRRLLQLQRFTPRRTISSSRTPPSLASRTHSSHSCLLPTRASSRLTRISFTSPTSPTAQLYRPSRHFHSTAGVTKTRPSTSLTTEQRIRNRSTRIKGLPQWKADIPLNTPIEAIYFSKAKPSHPALLELFHQPSPLEPTVQIEQALKVYIDCRGTDKTLDSKDFMFVLQTIQDHASSQEQFWDSIATLIRSSSASQKLSVNIVEGMGHSPAVSWDAAIAGALSRVYWTQKQDVFIHQVQHAKIIDEKIEEEYHAQRMRGDLGSDQPQHFFPPFMATHQIMACTMVESLMLKFNAGYALELYGLMSELDIQMPGRVMAALLKIAVHSRNDYQLEKIGHLFVSECGRHSGNRHPPILTNAKLMDSFVYGACEHELYDLARDVFNKGLQAGGKYRAQTYTKILNSYSVKEFGFDIVIAGTIEQDRKHRMNRYKPHRNPESPTTATRRRRAITVAKPEDLEYYIQRMEQQAIEPTITTLNVLVKLYLEMAQYKVEDAPSWMAAFKRFNPQGLKPDVVTNNILLAHYERHRDLSTMLKIYNDLAGELEDSGAPDGLLKRNRRNNVSQIVEPATLDLMEDRGKRDQSRQEHQDNDPLTPLQQQQLSEQEKLHNLEETAARQQLARHRQKRARSSRDIYTYNTMIHALLQHAVESKDVAAIGQCFHDMEQDKIPADVVTYNTNILYHVANGDLGAAVQVFRCMNQTGDVPDPSLVDTSKPVKSLPSYAHYNHHIHRGHVTKESITAKGTDTAAECQEHPSTSAPPGIPAPDVVTMTTLIQGFGQAKDLQQVASFFREMTDVFKIEPNLKTFSSLVAALDQVRDHARAKRLWDMVLKEDHMERNEVRRRAEMEAGDTKAKEMEEIEEIENRDHPHDGAGRNRRRILTVIERKIVEARQWMFRDSLKN